VRRLEARWPGHCATRLRKRHEGCHASSRDEGYTETEAVTDGTVGEGAQVNVAGKPETRAATRFTAPAALAKGSEG
jgi:hypothetical protein